MYHTIKTLLAQGQSVRSIAKQLNIHRQTVRTIKQRIAHGLGPPKYERDHLLSDYEDQILGYLKDNLTSVLIHRRLCERHGLRVSYSTVRRFVKQLKGNTETFVPLHSEPGEEAQVDFGYLGRFQTDQGRTVKVWGFSMVLSNSRYAYHEVVLDQKVATFIRCHIHAFEFFGGVPQQVKLDNLKSGVIEPNFYEPLLQEQYAEFLAHYGCAGVPCRVRKPEHKGKVESAVKYVKGNFVLGLTQQQRKWKGLQDLLHQWTDQTANRRVHGTTRQVPVQVFLEKEKPALQPLPPHRYELIRWEQRRVNPYGHISFACNFYSVPYQLKGQSVTVKSNGYVLRVYQGQKEVAMHPVATQKGQNITLEAHKPPHKREQSPQAYRTKMEQIGAAAVAFMEGCQQQDFAHWKEKVRGILSLRKNYDATLINQSCQSVVDCGLFSYRSVKRICEHRADAQPPPTPLVPMPLINQGYHHDLASYDQL